MRAIVNAPALQSLPDAAVTAKKTVFLGLGNDILGDDAVGLKVAREIRRRLSGADNMEVFETSEMGLSLLDFIVGFDDLILVDAVQTGGASPGFVHEWDDGGLQVLSRGSPHFLGVGEVLALGRRLGLAVPQRVKVFAVEVQDPFTVTESLTPALRQALPAIVEHVFRAIYPILPILPIATNRD
jgi:hydrogenase maturation protease